MFIKSIKLLNYKSYIDSGEIGFTPGINIIIGKNNSGKTALLEALVLRLASNPHRSVRTLPTQFSKIDKQSRLEVALSAERSEFRNLLEQLKSPLRIRIPVSESYLENDGSEEQKSFLERFKYWLNKEIPTDLKLSIFDNQSNEVSEIDGFFDSYPSLQELDGSFIYHGISIFRAESGEVDIYSEDESIEKYYGGDSSAYYDFNRSTGPYSESIAYKSFDLFRNRIYRFYAERLNIGNCDYIGNPELQPDASNLAEVLYLLPRNPALFNRFNQLASEIFPDIKYVSSVEITKIDVNVTRVSIRVWSGEAAREQREDLALPLSACGTGISQVLAILYVVVTSSLPRTIIIDEPQSFLHPGAAKKLVEILKEFPQHQYFIATHSPMLIAAANPSQIIQLVHDGCETVVSTIQASEIADQKAIMAEVGVRLSDVFGADNILWVEGQTEEQCFPLILEKVAKRNLNGTVILRVRATGELEGKQSELIFDIYSRLSGGKYLFPPAVGFLLDREGKTEDQIEGFKKRSSNKIEFLPRRMYENYLLLPEAIAFVISHDDDPEQPNISVIAVEAWINQKRKSGCYLKTRKENITEQEWLEQVDASKLLKDLFSELSETRVQFSKPKHSSQLTDWVIEHKPQHLQGLASFLSKLIAGNL